MKRLYTPLKKRDYSSESDEARFVSKPQATPNEQKSKAVNMSPGVPKRKMNFYRSGDDSSSSEESGAYGNMKTPVKGYQPG
jgi:hypothetical protein